VNDPEAKRARIKDRITASQDRLRRDQGGKPALQRFPDQHPPEDYRSLAGEYPWLAMAGGLAAGVLIGALLPRQAGSKLGARALSVATIAGELGLALSKTARSRAGKTGRDGMTRIGEGRTQLRSRAAGTARSTGLAIVEQAIKLAAKARR
jgi:predicted lipid-binding transport protein (Tim44 family)